MFAQVTVSAARSMAAVTAELPAGLFIWALVTSRNGDRSMRSSTLQCGQGLHLQGDEYQSVTHTLAAQSAPLAAHGLNGDALNVIVWVKLGA